MTKNLQRRRSPEAGQLEREYGFTDVDGSRPDVWKYMEDVEQGLNVDPSAYR